MLCNTIGTYDCRFQKSELVKLECLIWRVAAVARLRFQKCVGRESVYALPPYLLDA